MKIECFCEKCRDLTPHSLTASISNDVLTTVLVCEQCGEATIEHDPVEEIAQRAIKIVSIGNAIQISDGLRLALEQVKIVIVDPFEKLAESMKKAVNDMSLMNDFKCVPLNNEESTKPWKKKKFYQ